MHADDAKKLRLTLFDKHDPILHQYFVRSYTYGHFLYPCRSYYPISAMIGRRLVLARPAGAVVRLPVGFGGGFNVWPRLLSGSEGVSAAAVAAVSVRRQHRSQSTPVWVTVPTGHPGGGGPLSLPSC